ncbi:MAG: spore coat associated protein CotJA [Clostridia bacterium]|nr:spore coat associated protein CotJA [Clostridia bacterium]
MNPLWKPYCPQSALPTDTAVTMAYVPYQTDTTLYCPETALQNGTVFKSLDKPFLGGRCR